MKASRRSFLGAISSGAVSAMLSRPANGETAQQPRAGKSAAANSDGPLVDLVNLLQGTDSTPLFSRGNTLPLTAVPFGMAHWTLQTAADTPWFFNPHERRTQGFRCTHQLSPWLSDYGQAIFFPYTGETQFDPGGRASSYRPEESVMRPYRMKLKLLRSQTTMELTPTERCSMLRLTFAEANAGLIIDLPGKTAELTQAGAKFFATVRENAGGTVAGFATYYVIVPDIPCKLSASHDWKTHRIRALEFGNTGRTTVEVRIGTSFISHEQAMANLDLEIGAKSFDTLAEEAKATWEHHLSRAVVQGGTEEQRRVFYSALYRALLFPRVWHEPKVGGGVHHWSPYTGKVTDGTLYADHGYWDVYRAWYPLMSILFPQRLGEILASWVNAAEEGGWLPQFPCPGYRACMTGSLIDAVFADAAVKGIGGFDLKKAYAYLHKHATQVGDPERGYGRRGFAEYAKDGYVPMGAVEQAVAETVDAAYGDFCLAQVASVLGYKEDQAFFEKRSGNWRNLFDGKTGFLRAKDAHGAFVEPFDAIRWGDPYVEGSAWQHRWDVPHDPGALIAAVGGAKSAAEQLELMLTQDPAFHVGFYGKEIHEMSEMAAVPFGQYAHSNQPVHHVLYLFDTAGRRDRLQYWVRRVLTELYTLDTFAGDEDTGSMSAWFLLSSMGFYPLCPGKPEYTVGSPLFDRVTLTPESGTPITIVAHGNGEGQPYVRQLKVNGAVRSGGTLRHDELVRGATLEFTMSGSPRG